ncbi:MAG TPA: transglycosylase SLT domain-containing protein [Methylomirabilota bacterium]|nr:transglycosylase SLT domain-containing protein [Methylomirabilota bacterium]
MKRTSHWFLSLFFFCLALAPTKTWTQTNPPNQEAFPLLPGLEKPVEFWKKVFTEYSLSQLIFFDALDMGKIYEVLDVGEGSRSQTYIDGERARIAAANGVDVERIQVQRGIKERMIAGLKLSGRYMQHIEQIFREKNLPVELGYLPLVESSFNINARSFAGAMGMWQFMRITGKEFRLRIDRVIDERKDPLESSRAAAALLNQNYQVLGNWPLALTAYNYGAGGLARAVAEIQSDNLVELIQGYNHPYWGFAPKNFYAEFLAAVDVAKNIDRYFPGLELDSPLAVREIELKSSMSMGVLARTTGLSHNELLGWNPALTAQIRLVPAGYRVKVPLDSKAEPVFEVAQSQEQAQPQVVRHRVKRGETLLQIARRYGASMDRILQLNGMRKTHLLQVGMTLLIPKI